MKVNVKRARQQQTQAELTRNDNDAMSCGFAIACLRLRCSENPKCNFGKKRLNGIVRDVYQELYSQFERYGSEEDKTITPETVPFLYTGLRNQVLALDVDLDGIEEKYAFESHFRVWRNDRDKEKRAHRYLVLQNREKMFRSIWYAFMLVLWKKHGFGTVRLNRFYDGVRRNYLNVFSYYLVCRDRDDAIVSLTVKKTLELMDRLGMAV